MSGFGANPTTGTQGALPTNQFPLSSVAVPGTANGDLTALEGGPASTDANGNKTAPASMYVKDGGDVNSGATTDAAVTTDITATISAKLRGLVKISGDIWDSTNHRIRVDGSGVTQPISAASLPLPSGAATSAKQPALGTAGTASSDVITVQGIASMTPLKTDGSGVTQPVSGSVSVSNFPGTQAVSGTVTANAGTGTFNNQQSNVQADYDTGAGTQNITIFGVALPASGGAVAGGTSSNPLRVDPTGTTTQPVSGTVNAAQSGTWNITNISGTVSLPTGAATSAKQPALGTAGSASSDVLTVQGIASMTPIKTDGSGVTQPVSGTVSITANSAVNVTQVGGNNIATGTGASGNGIPRVTVSNDSEIQLWDGTNGPVAVKAAATSPAIADKAMVYSLSPNNTGLPVNLPAIVQSTNNKSSGSVASLAKAFNSNNTQGNSIIVVCAVGNGTAPTISDTASNTYTQAAQVANSTTLNVAVFYAVGIASGANTVTVNNGGATASIAMEIYEVSGLITQVQAQPDQTATNTGSSGTASTSTISPSSPNEIAFAGVGIGTAAQTITVGSGWTNDSGQQNPTTPAGLFSFVSMSQFLGSLKAVTPQATFTSEPWAIAVATFRPVVLGTEGTTKITDGTITMGFGSKTSANSMPVVIASDQGNVNVAVNAALPAGSNLIGAVNLDLSGTAIKDDTQFGDEVTSGIISSTSRYWNGSSYDRQYGNQDNITLLASAARTTTQTVADQTNFNGRGVIVVLDVTSAGTGSITLEIDGKDPVSGKYYAILTGAAVTTSVTNVYTVYPGNTVTANVSASTVLPRTWRVKVTANNANSITYSVGAMIIV